MLGKLKDAVTRYNGMVDYLGRIHWNTPNPANCLASAGNGKFRKRRAYRP